MLWERAVQLAKLSATFFYASVSYLYEYIISVNLINFNYQKFDWEGKLYIKMENLATFYDSSIINRWSLALVLVL